MNGTWVVLRYENNLLTPNLVYGPYWNEEEAETVVARLDAVTPYARNVHYESGEVTFPPRVTDICADPECCHPRDMHDPICQCAMCYGGFQEKQ